MPPTALRWLALLLVSTAMSGNYYVFDALNPVGPLLESQLGFSQARIGQLDTAYNVAALLVLLVGGVVIDRAGTRRAVVLFGVVAAAGGALIALSPGGFSGMVAGRFVLGLGSEPLIVAVTTALAKWFKGRELAFAMGLNLTMSRLGSVAADTSRGWAPHLFTGWQPPLLLAAGVGAACVVAGALYWAVEGWAARRYDLGRAAPSDRLVLADVRRFRLAYWWVVGLCVAFYSAVFPFRRFANIFLVDARGVSPEQAGYLNGLLPLTAMIATPLFGLLADRIGRRGLLMTIGSLILLPAFPLLVYSTWPVQLPIALIGIAFSLIPAVMWAAVAYLVDETRLGTAYALMTFCQQVGWAIVAWAVGHLNDASGAGATNPAGYAPGMWVFTSLALVGLLFAVLLRKQEADIPRT
jgi:MFS family permease